ncbi:MAG: hypothetical protein U0840_29265 [Gemmataceae bacterium]
MQTLARMLVVGLLAVTLLLEPHSAADPAPEAPSSRVVYLAGGLGDQALLQLSVAVAAQPGAVLLMDSLEATAALRRLLVDLRPSRIIPVGEFAEGQTGLTRRLGVVVSPIQARLAEDPTATRVVLCGTESRRLLLRAAHLAALEKIPLRIVGETVSRQDKKATPRQVIVVGPARPSTPGKVIHLPTEEAVEARTLRLLTRGRGIETAVLANPADTTKELGGMAVLAPWIAATRRAALVLTNAPGTDVAPRIEALVQQHAPRLDALLYVANLKAIPMWQRPNPIPGDKDQGIDLEPLTPTGESGLPVSYAMGRLFHEDRAVVPLMLAGQLTAKEKPGPRRALVASNPGGGLALLETFSRNTANELANGGFAVTQLYGRQLNAEVLRREMPRHEFILWEGHHNTLVKEWGFTTWDEPLPSAFVFLQSCLALMPEKVQPLLSRGVLGVVGTSTRTYSGSGGAFSLAFTNAMVYENQSLGGSLRQAKNFLLAYSLLKDRRLGSLASRRGANLRAAWAFTLWGDPTYRLPVPPVSGSALAPVHHEVQRDEIILRLPGDTHEPVRSDTYRVKMPVNGRLAGLIRKGEDRAVVPLAFAEVRLPRAREGLVPRLKTRLPSSAWAFLWDARRQTGYLLVAPREEQCGELRFRVEWSGVRVAGRAE